ncbi:c-type cytochrome [Salipaludibacillus sp. CF4.18]|uniref:c-type cytochrome n=1 Tax=Salipaludibacillus sp. CF4.18 TaxID=3373081 RepID=UPI003EE5F442
MKKLVFAIMGSVLVLGACGGDDANNEEVPENNNAVEESAGGNDTYDATNGEEVYVGNCAACHGGDLEGASGPDLHGISADVILATIEEGPGNMPAELVSGQDAEDVAAWVSEQ